jgi:peptide/nickel transport system substrate-binding protein
MLTLLGRSLGVRLVQAAALASVAVAIAGCGSSSSSSSNGQDQGVQSGRWGGVINAGGTPVNGGSLTIDQADAVQGISSLFYDNSATNQIGQVVEQMYDQLLEYRPGSLDPQPGLASSWQVSKDDRTYTFHLRKAEFSNGMPVTSQDVKFSLEYAKNPKSIYTPLYGGITGIDTPDPSTVVVHLSQPTPAFLDYVAYIAASVVPSKLVKSEGLTKYNNHPIGSGPFMLQNWTRNQSVVLVRNPQYWRSGLPYLKEVTLRAAPNDNTRVLDIQSGTVSVSDYVPFSQVGTINSSGKAKVLIAPGADMYVVWLNNSKPPFNETAVRQALNYATPVDSIIHTVFSGLASPRMSSIIPKLKYWSSAVKAYPYDVAKAKQVLATSSVPNGFHTTIEVVGTGDQATFLTAQILQSAWAKIGVKVTIKPVDGATQGTDYGGGKYDVTLITPGAVTADVPADDEFANFLFNSPNTNNLYTFSHQPALAAIVKQATTTTDEAERARLFEELQAESIKDPSVVPMVYTPNRAAVANDVHNFSYMLGGLWPLDSVWKH